MAEKIAVEKVTYTDLHRYVADASELGWHPGMCPREVELAVGNGLNFFLEKVDQHQISYVQLAGCLQLIVYND